MPEPSEPVSRRLRADTAEVHARTEAEMDLPGRMATREGYAATLGRIEAFYHSAEPIVFRACSGHVPGEFLSSRLSPINADLAVVEPHWRSVSASFPSLEWPEALGALYVMEGAALGGQIIARYLSSALGLTPEHGASFFASEGAAVGPRWKAFRALLDQYPDDYEAILAGANATFEAFRAAVCS